MSQGRAERLVNLALCLMSSQFRVWTADDIRRTVPGYQHPDTPAGESAFRRAFERDKDELRGFGMPVETTTAPSGVDGYRIRRQDAFLPEINLDPDEARAVALAVRMWRTGRMANAATHAWHKLRAAGVNADTDTAVPFDTVPAVDTGEPAFDQLLAAVQAGTPVRFHYRRSGQVQPELREVEPWGLRAARGRWYLVGHDRDRRATRVFRLSRITAEVVPCGPAGSVRRPPDVDLKAAVDQLTPQAGDRLARVRLRDGRAHEVRRMASTLTADPGGDPGYRIAEVPFSDVGRAAILMASYGAEAVVLGPQDLRAAVVAILQCQTVSA